MKLHWQRRRSQENKVGGKSFPPRDIWRRLDNLSRTVILLGNMSLLYRWPAVQTCQRSTNQRGKACTLLGPPASSGHPRMVSPSRLHPCTFSLGSVSNVSISCGFSCQMNKEKSNVWRGANQVHNSCRKLVLRERTSRCHNGSNTAAQLCHCKIGR